MGDRGSTLLGYSCALIIAPVLHLHVFRLFRYDSTFMHARTRAHLKAICSFELGPYRVSAHPHSTSPTILCLRSGVGSGGGAARGACAKICLCPPLSDP